MKNSQNMLALLLLLLVGGGLFMYKSFFTQEVLVETEQVAQQAAAARALYDDVNNINLDRAFLDSSLVNTLVNFYVIPESQSPGRPNPFITVPSGVSGPRTIPRTIESNS